MVLLAFADAANDDGLTWIALKSERGKLDMQTKRSISRRLLSAHVASFQADGYAERHETVGKGGIWRVHATPANFARVSPATPAEIATPWQKLRGNH
ncbi:hypothetical protein H5J25_00165 [Sphingomonas aliaeris]|uniref:Uncharacterized protein n=1 Tax=Sphingomonas aliaeris TaxID=2759526 RepID=A0A974NV50_9SPHN|nr:hypothetical protein [Sphingomonas aliaeris]QQV77303.1 hypothetical protein H5J25_00165 [Sphingomonas aliaeris]